MTNRFSIQQILSDHGTGQLARALDSKTGMAVVIRVFQAASDTERESLQALLNVLATLAHPNLEPVHEVVLEGNQVIVVTEELVGETIPELVAQGPLSPKEFRAVATQLLAGLSAAHQRGAVHGSIHAGRVLVTRRPGEAWVARITGYGLGFSDAPQDGNVSPFLCVPPEQWEQQPARRRSDVYSIGCLFYQALSGRSPFDGKTLKEVRHKHLTHDLRPLQQLAPQAPDWLCNWVMTMLEAVPDQRMESAVVALDRFRTTEISHGTGTATQSVPLPVMAGGTGAVASSTGFVKVAGSAYFRVPSLATQTVSVAPIDPLVQTARHAARRADQTAAARARAPAAGQATVSARGHAAARPGSTTRVARGTNTRFWLGAGAAALGVAGVIVYLVSGGSPKTYKVDDGAVKPASSIKVAANPGSNDKLPPVSGGYPAGRQKPVAYPWLVFHAMCDGGVMGERQGSEQKRQPANVNNPVFLWKDFAERGRDSSLSFPANEGTTFPTLISRKPDATFPLARERRFISFTGQGTPGAAFKSTAKDQGREFPFGPGPDDEVRGLTFAVVFFEEVKGYTQTLLHLSSGKGSAIVRIGDRGEVRFNGRINGIADNQQHPTLVIPQDKFNPVEPLLIIGTWKADPAEVRMRIRTASGYSFQTPPLRAPVPVEPLGNLLIGRDYLPSPNAQNKAIDARALHAFCGGIAELLIYSSGLKDDDVKTLEDQLAAYYFPALH